jgi:hypothetical protein
MFCVQTVSVFSSIQKTETRNVAKRETNAETQFTKPRERPNTCFNTHTTLLSGIPGVRKLSNDPEAKTDRFFCRSATRLATGATLWSMSRSRTKRSPD